MLKKVVPPGFGYPTDYCAFTSIRDVFFDSLVPEKFVLGGVQVFPSVETPTLRDRRLVCRGAWRDFTKC